MSFRHTKNRGGRRKAWREDNIVLSVPTHKATQEATGCVPWRCAGVSCCHRVPRSMGGFQESVSSKSCWPYGNPYSIFPRRCLGLVGKVCMCFMEGIWVWEIRHQLRREFPCSPAILRLFVTYALSVFSQLDNSPGSLALMAHFSSKL